MINMIIILIIIIILLLYVLNKEQFVNNNIQQNVTICLKTLYRKDLLYTNLNEIRKIMPNIKIIVADDSDDTYKIKNKNIINKFKNIEYLDLPYDSGLSYGRNKAVEKVNTKYTIITDDSRCITDTKQLGNLIKFMDNNEKYDLISGNVLERGKFAGKFTYLFDIDDKPKIMNTINQNDKIKIKIKHKNINDLKIIDNNLKLYKTHIGVNCFIARTTVLKKHKWDNNLKLREHKHFFLNLFLNNINVLYCDKFIFKQFNSNLRKYDMSGLKLRRRNFTNNITFY